MEIKHTHPVYTSETERRERLEELRKLCSVELRSGRSGGKPG
ncbi:MAG: hypothetical protein Q4C76_00315 [Bacillota bacterium]|nr:hypothetical protein [Bacillota bacterium]